MAQAMAICRAGSAYLTVESVTGERVVPTTQWGILRGVGFHVRRRYGEMITEPSDRDLDAALAELDGPDDAEHPDVSLSHDSEWTFIAFPSGLLVWENVEEDAEIHLPNVPRAEVRRLWKSLARGDLAAVNAEPWQPGYGA